MGDISFAGVRDVYRASGIGASTGFGDSCAIVVIDLQRGFTEAASGVGGELASVIAATNGVTAAARRAATPVMFTSVSFQSGQESAWLRKMPGLAVLRHGSDFCELDSRVERRSDEPLWTKSAPSAFFGTPLLSHLVSLRADTVVLCGCVTSGCVRATAIDAASSGFRVVVPREAVGDRDESVHQANLFDIDSKYGDVMASADVVDRLRSS